MTCALCNETVMEDAAIYDRNPQTNRFATMHPDCWQDAYDNLSDEEKNSYQDRDD